MNMRKEIWGSVLAATLAAGAFWATPAKASSHREAPFITSLPKADGTDFYLFRSYEPGRDGFVTFVADYQPLQSPAGAPNYYELDPEVRYNINIDNSGSGKANMVFSFQFGANQRDAELMIGDKKVAVSEKALGPIKAGDDSKSNRVELYSLSVFRGGPEARNGAQAVTNADNSSSNSNTAQGGKASPLGKSTFIKPTDYIGDKTFPDYNAYAKQFIYSINIPGCDTPGRVFVGARKDPFVVNVAEVFDLVNLNPLGAMDQGKDDLAASNISAFVLEVPIKCVAFGNKVIGAWTTAEMPRSRIGNQSFLPKDKQNTEGEAKGKNGQSAPDEWIQVSRVGAPLVNELVIGLKDKDKFNASEPKDDAQFINYVTNPTLPALLEVLFGDKGVKAPTLFPRADLVQAFLTGIPGVNANGAVGEMLRLNVTTPVTPAAGQSNLGVLGKDNAGFPNGRRPGDDVVDIELRVAMGVLLTLDPKTAAAAPSGALPFTDGAFTDASHYDTTFPYLRPPLTNSSKPTHAPATK